MSETKSLKINSLDSKMKDLSDYLRKSVIDPAGKEKQEIIADAEKEAVQILKDAKKEAEEIVKDAELKSQTLKAKADSALNIAKRQAVDSLKIALEKKILANVITKPVKKALKSEDLIKEFVRDVLKIYSSDTNSYELSLSGEMKEKLNNFLLEELGKTVVNGIKLGEESILSGFTVSVEGTGLKFDFSEESLIDLLTEYIRPELRKVLFEK